jgi:hypothetical protein
MISALALALVGASPIQLAFRPEQVAYRYQLTQSYKDPEDGDVVEKLVWSESIWVKGDGVKVVLDRTVRLQEHWLGDEKLDLPKDQKDTKVSETIDRRGYREWRLGIHADPIQVRLDRLTWMLFPEGELEIGQRWETSEPGLPERGIPKANFRGVFEGIDRTDPKQDLVQLRWTMQEEDYGMSASGRGVFQLLTGMPQSVKIDVSNARMAGNPQTRFDLEIDYRRTR